MDAKTSQLRFETVVRYEWQFLLINFSALIEANLIIKRFTIFLPSYPNMYQIKSLDILGYYLIFLNCLFDLWT